MYALLEGLSRHILGMDTQKLAKMPGGVDLLAITKICKENARYAQQRIKWIKEGYSWDDVEGSEQLQLDQPVLNKHKTGKVLSRSKLQVLMREQREKYLEERKKARTATGATGGGKASTLRNLRAQVTQMQAKLSKKRQKGLFLTTPPTKKTRVHPPPPFCKWCKRAGRMSSMNSHNSPLCKKKPAGVT